MGFMEKMRASTGAVLWVLVIAFGVLFMLQDTQVFDAVMAGPQNMGEVNGHPITHTEFNNRVQQFSEQYRQQTGNPPSREQRAYYEEIVWDQMVLELALRDVMEELGITVSDDELMELVHGDDPDPFIRQIFTGQDGQIDRASLNQALSDPNLAGEWAFIEEQIRDRRRQEKLNEYITSFQTVTSREIEIDYISANTRADVSFVRIPFSEVSDNEITISDSDVRSYYRANREKFHRDQTWRFRHVSFSKEPTADDTLRTVNLLENMRTDFANATNDSLFLALNFSTTPFQRSVEDVSELDPELQSVADLENGEVSEPFVTDENVKIIKRSNGRFVILSRNVEADPRETVTAQQFAADDFHADAAAYGFDEELERQGLEARQATLTKDTPFIAGIGESRLIVRHLRNARAGQVLEALELDDRFLVIRVDEVISAGPRPMEEVRSEIENTLRAKRQGDILMERARERFAGLGSLEAIAESAEREVQTASNLRMNASNLPGGGREPAIIGAIFGSEVETLKGPVRGDQAAFFFVVEERRDANIENLGSSERTRIRQRLEQQKAQIFTEKLIERLQDQARVRDHRNLFMQ